MNSSLPNDKDKAPQGAQTVAATTPSSSDSDSSKGEAGPTSQYVVGAPPQQDAVPTLGPLVSLNALMISQPVSPIMMHSFRLFCIFSIK